MYGTVLSKEGIYRKSRNTIIKNRYSVALKSKLECNRTRQYNKKQNSTVQCGRAKRRAGNRKEQYFIKLNLLQGS